MTRFSVITLSILVLSPTALGEPTVDRLARFAVDDPRLATPVTIADYEVYVGDLLDRLASRTGISVSCRERDGSGDARIAVYCRDLPMKEMMRAVVSLVSHNGAEAAWERDGEAGKYKYRLVFPQNARTLPRRLREGAQSAFEELAWLYVRLAQMEPTERAKHVRHISQHLSQDNDELAKSILSGERRWNGLRLFANSLSPEQQREVISGRTKIVVDASDLTPSGRALLLEQWKGGSTARTRDRDGTIKPIPAPERIRFDAARMGADITRSLYIDLDRLGGYSYAGGVPLERAYKKKVRKLWFTPDCSLDPPEGIELAPAGKPESPLRDDPRKKTATVGFKPSRLESRLREFSERANVAVLARVSEIYYEDPGDAPTVGEYVKKITEMAYGLNHKWAGRALLLEEPSWFWTEEKLPPYESMKWFRLRMDKRQGKLTFADLCELSSRFTAPQLLSSLRQYPGFDAIAAWLPLYRACAGRADWRSAICSERGLEITEELRARIGGRASNVPVSLPQDTLLPKGARAVFFESKLGSAQADESAARPDVDYRIGFITAEGAKRTVGSFSLPAAVPGHGP